MNEDTWVFGNTNASVPTSSHTTSSSVLDNKESLVENAFSKWEEKPDPIVPKATYEIYNYINEYLGRKPDTHVNRASSASMCFKRRWYQRNNYPSTPLTPRKLVNFLLGDLSEKTMQHFIKEGCVGPGKLYSEVFFGKEIGKFKIQGKDIIVYEQEDLTAQLGEITVTCHVDGWGLRNSDKQWELIECKSAADYGFDSFVTNGPGDYLKQSTVNLRTDKAFELNALSVRFFYLKKNTGHLWDRVFNFDLELSKDVEQEYFLANSDKEPKRPHVPQPEKFRGKPTGRKVLPWQCGYCSYTETCWKNEASLEFKNNKPIWVVP